MFLKSYIFGLWVKKRPQEHFEFKFLTFGALLGRPEKQHMRAEYLLMVFDYFRKAAPGRSAPKSRSELSDVTELDPANC